MDEQYHLDELKVALDPANPAHILPPPHPEGGRVLDIGCGAGQTLLAAYPGKITFGLDVDADALKMGKSLTSDVRFLCGSAEQLPLASGQFDLVISRVCLPLTNMPRSLKEIRRVLRSGGRVWMTLHTIAVPRRRLKDANIKGWIYFGYILVNSLVFHITQKQIGLLGRYESFQTERGISRALQKIGFTNIKVTKGRHFLVTAEAASQQ